jgi:S-adenosylmethionine synthetase
VRDEEGKILSDTTIGEIVQQIFDMRPYAIVERLKLKNPIYSKTAAYGHMGKLPMTQQVQFGKNGMTTFREVEFFTWEKLDYVSQIQKAFLKH